MGVEEARQERSIRDKENLILKRNNRFSTASKEVPMLRRTRSEDWFRFLFNLLNKLNGIFLFTFLAGEMAPKSEMKKPTRTF